MGHVTHAKRNPRLNKVTVNETLVRLTKITNDGNQVHGMSTSKVVSIKVKRVACKNS